MPKASPLINNFSAGEFGPLARARVDLDRYQASQELCQNFIPRVQGGAQKREATKYVAGTKNDGKVRLEKFVFSNDQAYVLEFGDEYIRFYTEGAQITSGGSPVEVTTTYDVTDVFALSFFQSNDILYIFHPEYAPAKLIRSSDTVWSLRTISFYGGPYLNYLDFTANGFYALDVSATSGSITIQTTPFTITSCVNQGGQYKCTVGGINELKTGDTVYVSGLTSATGSTGDWVITIISANEFLLNGSTYVADATTTGTLRYGAFSSSDVGRSIIARRTGFGISTPDANWGIAEITAFTNSSTVTAQVTSAFSSTNAKTRFALSGYSSSSGFPAGGCFHEDRLWMIGPSSYITGSRVGDYENFVPFAVDGTVADDDSISFSLSSNESYAPRWLVSDEKGLLAGTSSGEFLIKSGSTQSTITPTSVIAKKATSYGSKQIQPVQAGKAVVFPQPSGRKIREFNYFYDVDGFRCQDITQLAHHIADSGVVQMALQKQPEQTIWAVREDGVLIGCSYERDSDGLRVAWHRHIIGGVSDAANNDAIVESVACVPTDDNSYDEIWLSVKRRINGNTKRYVEYIGRPFNDEVEQEDAKFADSYLTYDSPVTVTGVTKANPAVVTAASHGFSNGDKVRFDELLGMNELEGNVYKVANVTANTFELTDFDGDNINSTSYTTYVSGGEVRKLVTSISGLTHLEGQTVAVLADGANLGTYTVSSGAITLDEPSAVVQVGLPYKARIKLQRLEAGSADGTSLGKTRRIHRLGLFLHRTLGLKYGQNFDEMIPCEFQSGNDQMNQPADLFSGILTTEVEMQYDFDNQICLESDTPTPCTLLAIMPQMHTQDR